MNSRGGGGGMRALDSQFYAFFALALAGVVIGLLFDLLRLLHSRLYQRPLVAAAADLSFWVLVTLVLAIALFLGNWGDLRFYVLVAVSAGAMLYFALAGPVVRWLLAGLLGALLWVWAALGSLAGCLLVAPVVVVATAAWRGVRWLGRAVGWLGRGWPK